MSEPPILACPRCGCPVEIAAFNCGVFICGATRAGQLPPHDEAGARRAAAAGELVAGCGGQFAVRAGPTGLVAEPCSGR